MTNRDKLDYDARELPQEELFGELLYWLEIDVAQRKKELEDGLERFERLFRVANEMSLKENPSEKTLNFFRFWLENLNRRRTIEARTPGWSDMPLSEQMALIQREVERVADKYRGIVSDELLDRVGWV